MANHFKAPRWCVNLTQYDEEDEVLNFYSYVFDTEEEADEVYEYITRELVLDEGWDVDAFEISAVLDTVASAIAEIDSEILGKPNSRSDG